MARCRACDHEIEPGYTFCHSCGASIGSTEGENPTSSNTLADLVDEAQALGHQIREVASAPIRFDRWLGSPISVRRQITYALASGFVLTSGLPIWTGWAFWLNAWLLCSFILFWPIRYWTTGVFPLARALTAVVGGELSLRRRLIFALGLTIVPSLLLQLLVFMLPTSLTTEQHFSPYAANHEPLDRGCFALLSFAGSLLLNFYLMGFVSSWRSISPSGFWVSQEKLAGQVATVVDQIMDAIKRQDIRGLQSTRISLAKLQGSTWIPPGTIGEQLSLTHGKARVVIFIQKFGEGLFLRTTSFYDGSGRRLWLLIGFLVSFLEGVSQRWFGTSFLTMSQQASEVLSPANKQQVVLRWSTAGLVARTLRLVGGISEYSWNEIHALEGAVQESVVTTLETAAGSYQQAERIRSQVEGQMNRERRFASGGRGRGNEP